MRATVITPPTPLPVPDILAQAPHRLLFFAGTCAVLISMAWWALQLASLRYGWGHWPQPPVPPTWGHALLTVYGMLPLFMFGFLLTVFPRWLDRTALPRRRYVPVAGTVFGGYLLAHAGLLGSLALLRAGVLLIAIGYGVALVTLAQVLAASTARQAHAWSYLGALAVGSGGLIAGLAALSGAPPVAMTLAIRLGVFGFLLPIYFSVCHRMIPFFSANVIPGYRMWRPRASLVLAWTLLTAHVALELAGAQAWRWLADASLALLFATHALMWRPWQARRPGLLLALHLAFAWLPVAFALYALQSAWQLATGENVLGLAPLHVLTIGYFGSMLVAMVTRVTQGHSGRLLQMGAVPWLCFVLLQGVVALRVRAELGLDSYRWLVLAAAGWLIAFAPWVLRSAWIYLTPRADGKPG
ncbi:NnrS family protein [Dyella sp.]|uniref:NnrS family protein n=1 Tax=Dyella sp. TaxID=1869338 RepID=UPI003F7DA6B5